MNDINVNRIVRLRINSDGKGVRSVIFLHGCPLSCRWCCNPETRTSDGYRTLDARSLFDCIRRDIPYFLTDNSGVTFSGGEPLLYADFIRDFIKEYCVGFGADIETSLYGTRESVEMLYDVIDEWFTDLKVLDDDLHKKLTGVSSDVIKENFRALSENVPHDRITVTYPMIPGVNVTTDELKRRMEFLDSLGLYNIELHPYRKSAEKKHTDAGLEPTVYPELSKEIYKAVKSDLVSNGFVIREPKIVVGRDKCDYLKELRRKYVKDNDITADIAECTYVGPCKGTCPRCEYELDKLSELTGL